MKQNTRTTAGERTQKMQKVLRCIVATIEQKDIEEAERGNSRHCMIKDAIQRRYKKFRNLWVDKNHIRFTLGDHIYTFEMSAVGRLMLLKFDNGEQLSPRKLTFRNPVIRPRIAGKDGVKRPRSNAGGRGIVPRPTTPSGAKVSGRDRVFGQRLFTNELHTLRELLLPSPKELAA